MTQLTTGIPKKPATWKTIWELRHRHYKKETNMKSWCEAF